jgi:hypothetical protein
MRSENEIILTRVAVQVSKTQNVGGTALGATSSADRKLAGLERSSHGHGGESEDDGVEHVDDCWLVKMVLR